MTRRKLDSWADVGVSEAWMAGPVDDSVRWKISPWRLGIAVSLVLWSAIGLLAYAALA